MPKVGGSYARNGTQMRQSKLCRVTVWGAIWGLLVALFLYPDPLLPWGDCVADHILYFGVCSFFWAAMVYVTAMLVDVISE